MTIFTFVRHRKFGKHARNMLQLNVGARVGIYPVIHCGICEYCITGWESLCNKRKLVGEDIDGCHSEYVVVPAANIVELPPNIAFVDAARKSRNFHEMLS